MTVTKLSKLERERGYRRDNPERYREYQRKWVRNNPDKVKKMSLVTGGRPAPLRPMPAVCDVCGGPPQAGQGMHSDHCHVTNTWRGWLCGKCNRGIGLLQDSVDVLRKAVKYLEKH